MSIPPRTTPQLVQERLSWDWDSVSSLTPHIAVASALVDDVIKLAQQYGQSLPLGRDQLLETEIAAHIYKYSADRQRNSVPVQGAVTGGSFTGQTGMFLEGTTYGQMALALDSTGSLRAIAKGEEITQDTSTLENPAILEQLKQSI